MQTRINFQLPMKQDYNAHGDLEVYKVWETIQGEGPFSGTPAVFVRLHGCNLRCKFCDTDYTSTMLKVGTKTLVDAVKAIRKKGLVVLTGGEPFRQNIGPFMQELAGAGDYHVQIETNGTLFQDFPFYNNTVVCSPKTREVHDDLKPRIDAYKYVLSADAVCPDDGLPTSVLGAALRPARPHAGFKGDVYVQPEDTGDDARNKSNLTATLHSCLTFGYRLCLQTHKIIGVE